MDSNSNDSDQQHEVRFIVNSRIESTINKLKQLKVNEANNFSEVLKLKTINLKQAQQLSVLIRSRLKELEGIESLGTSWNGWVHELCINSDLHIPPKPERKKSPEFQAYLEKMKRKQEDMQYKQMSKTVNSSSFSTSPSSIIKDAEFSSLSKELGVGLNIIVLMATGFIVFWYVGKSIYKDDTVKPVFLGLIGLIGALLIETVLLIIREQKKDIRAKYHEEYQQQQIHQAQATHTKRAEEILKQHNKTKSKHAKKND